jgi:hypothetical protein
MLDAFIIEEIRRREQEAERQREQQRPRQELPIQRDPAWRREQDDEESSDRGVVIIDYSISNYG